MNKTFLITDPTVDKKTWIVDLSATRALDHYIRVQYGEATFALWAWKQGKDPKVLRKAFRVWPYKIAHEKDGPPVRKGTP